MSLVTLAAKLKRLAGDTTSTQTVTYSGEETAKKETPLTLLQDNTDEMVALLQALPSNAPIKESISQLSSAAQSVPRLLGQVASQLSEILQPGSDSKELAKIKATSGLNDLASMLEMYAKDFSELSDLASLLSSTSSKHTEKEKSKPIKHTLRRKEELKAPKPDASKEDEISLSDLDISKV